MSRIGHGYPCPKCGKRLIKFAWHGNCYHCGESFEPKPPPPPPPPGSKQYMVVSQTDEWFMGKFDPVKLQERLNQLGAEGWRVITATTSDVGTWFGTFNGIGGSRQEMVILMEKTAPLDKSPS